MPATFKDRTGEEFTIHLTLGDVYQIESYNFQGQIPKVTLIPPEDKFFEERIGDPKLLFGIAWCLIQRQIKDKLYKNPFFDPKCTNKELSESQEFVLITNELDFAYRFNGETLQNLKEAVWRELAGFFPQAATTILNLIGRLSKVAEVGIRRGNKLIETNLSDEQIEKMWDEIEESQMIKAAARGDGPTSSDSVPSLVKTGDQRQ